MISYQYTYFIGDLILTLCWIFVFLRRKDIRKEMLLMGIIFGIAAILTSKIYAQDWWKPLTISGKLPAIEDFLFGFLAGGIFSVIYEYLFNKKIKIKRNNKIRKIKRDIDLLLVIGLLAILPIGVILFKLNTFISTILAFAIPTLIIWIKRKDLIKDSLISGLLTLIIAIIIYQILNIITPGFFNEFWLFKNVGHIFLVGIPLEEIIWFFLAGAYMGPLYEYWKEGKLINIKK
jgi:hypothetical protein